MSTFRPIDFQPLDVTPGVNLLLAAKRAKSSEDLAKQNAETQRQFAENTNRRISAQEARDAEKHKLEIDDINHKRAVETAHALPDILQAAKKYGADYGNALGKPYGATFDEQVTQNPSPLDNSPLIQAAKKPVPQKAAEEAGEPPGLGPGEEVGEPLQPGYEGPQQFPSRPKASDDELLKLAEDASPQTSLADELANYQPETRHTYATVGGKRFEVPAEEPFTTGLGPQYDAIAQHLAEAGGGDKKAKQAALAEVARMYRADDSQAAIDQRAKASRTEKETENAKYDLTAADKKAMFDKKMAAQAAALAARKKKGGGASAAHGKEWQKEETELAGELNKYEQSHQLSGKGGLAEHQHDLETALKEAESPNQNGVTQLKILDKMIRAATGLGVRNQTLQTYMSHMTGLIGRGENVAQQYINGTVGKEAWKNVIESVRGDLAEAQGRGGKEYEQFRGVVGASPAFQRHPDLVSRREREMFGGLHGYSSGQQQAPTPVGPEAGAKKHKAKTQLDQLEELVDSLGKGR